MAIRRDQRVMVSVAITTYNGAKYLREQLDSIYAQTLPPEEVIVCDDGSTDTTISILEEYHRTKGLIYSINPHNVGYSANFFQAISLCKGDYVALSDQDDVWFPTKLEESISALSQIQGAGVISSQAQDTDASLNPLPIKESWGIAKEDQSVYASLISSRYSQGCTLMLNRAFINLFLPIVSANIRVFAQYPYDAIIGMIAVSIATKHNIPKPLMYYRRHDANVSGVLKSPQLSQKELIKLRPRYHHFMPDWRFDAAKDIETNFAALLKPDILPYYQILDAMHAAPTLIIGLRAMYRLPLSFRKKVEVTIYSIANNILCSFYAHR